mgnify:CR=1 FL=1|tara:strand:+ start:349 stop:1029 length:681 start_codon:yes stop_codon:yes gene_type:complete
MASEEESRTLRMEIPGSYLQTTVPGEWSDISESNGWSVSTLFPAIVYWEGTIDLSGYARDSKTFYPIGGVIQEGPAWIGTNPTGQLVYTAVSSVPFSVEDVTAQILNYSGPGFISSQFGALAGFTGNQNWETLIFAEAQINLLNNTMPAIGFCTPISVKQSGSLSPTAAEVLYVIKIVAPYDIAGDQGSALIIPASRVILPGTMGQEPELEYMMRLSRSVELANQV